MGIKKFVTGAFQTNTYLYVIGENALLVDPGQNISLVADEINKYHILAVLLTHSHLDHIDGIGLFNAPVYIHELDYPGLTDLSISMYKQCGCKPSYHLADLSVNLVKDNEEIAFDGFKIKVLHTPGHTKGSCCFLINGFLFSGDTLFKESCGRTDFPTGSQVAMRNSLNRLVKSLPKETIVYPGHDEKTTIKHEQNYNRFINKY